ncbi:MAG: sugar dehydrogenase [Actinomycetia bacterium]|nr:sugar dehydrogenase [Actinomycetes bacterium]
MGRTVIAIVVLAGALVALPAARQGARAQAATMTLPAGFQNQVVFSGLTQPTNFAFASDGRVFVAEKGGKIKVFDGLDDPTPTLFADLSTEVYDYQDRGLLGLALAPNFPTDPYVYVLYSLDAPIGGTPPRWNDTCPTPPGQSTDGCVTSSRLSRLQANGDVMTGTEKVLIEDWCQQFPSHSIGTVAFGSDGALYAGGGDGASYNYADYGQAGGTLTGNVNSIPRNPCGDPPGGVGGAMSPPTAQGGALRAQDVVAASDSASLDGTIIRVDPATGQPLPDNPNAAATDPKAQRIVANGLRNPFRFTFRPGTTDLWMGDVGWDTWEEINRHPDARASVKNFGWPCYEGSPVQPGYQALGLSLCQTLYDAPGAVTPPVYSYRHGVQIIPGNTNDFCGTSGGATSGVAFYNGGSLPGPAGTYPSTYDGALFFADYSRKCISVLLAGSNGLPDPTKAAPFASNVGLAGAVALQAGPGGDIYWADIGGGTIDRIRYFPNNRPPVAVIHSDATSGSLPLTVQFDGTSSTDADSDPLTYAWDLDGDGNYNDSTSATPTFTYNDTANHTVRLRVTDSAGASSTDSVVISSGNHPPSVTINTPDPSAQWKVGDVISFSASATDPEDGTLPASAFVWNVTLEHCPDGVNCHEHRIESFNGVKSGAFVAPDHEYPAHLKLSLTVNDASGVTAAQSVDLFPQTTTLSVASNVSGATLAVDGTAGPGPFTKTVIVGSSHVVTAPLQQVNGSVNDFDSWSDAGAQTHNVTVSAPTTLSASLSPRGMRAGDTSVLEGAQGATTMVSVPVTLDHAVTRPVSAEWVTQDGTATSGSDYTASAGTIDFPPGTTQRNVMVPVLGDNVTEGNETFGVRVSAPQNANLVKSLATVTIQDDETLPTVSLGFISAPEGNSGTTVANVPVTLSRASAQTVTVPYSTLDYGATANVDYQPANGTLTFAPGETTKNVPVNIIGDRLDESDEAAVVAVRSANNASVPGGAAYGAVTITDDDPPVSIIGGLGSVTEGNSGTTVVSIPIMLSAASGLTVKVNWATGAYQADGTDFVAASGSLTFLPGQTLRTVLVTVNGDTTRESDELFIVGMSSPVNATLGGIGPGLAFGKIINDD